jgi:hypothetical protein
MPVTTPVYINQNMSMSVKYFPTSLLAVNLKCYDNEDKLLYFAVTLITFQTVCISKHELLFLHFEVTCQIPSETPNI